MWLEQIPKYSFSVDIDQLEQFIYIAYYLIVFSHLLEKKTVNYRPIWGSDFSITAMTLNLYCNEL